MALMMSVPRSAGVSPERLAIEIRHLQRKLRGGPANGHGRRVWRDDDFASNL
jgi:hypothetical protein